MNHADTRVALLASGDRESGEGGSTADRVARDALEGKVAFTIGVVICNNPEGTVGVHSRFEQINHEYGLDGDDRIDVVTINSALFPGGPQPRGQTAEESSAVCRELERRSIDFVAMLGYLKVITTEFEQTWAWRPEYATDDMGFNYRSGLYHPGARISNNHPAILPFTVDTYGRHAHEKVLQLNRAGQLDQTAMTWHLVSAAIDRGPTIYEVPVDVLPSDTADTLGGRVQEVEKDLTATVLEHHLMMRAVHMRMETHNSPAAVPPPTSVW